MSSVVDDLHAAEDFCGRAAEALRRLLNAAPRPAPTLTNHPLAVARAEALAVVRCWEAYCRPGCEADGDHAKCQDDDPDCCGCPCGHAEAAS